MAHERDLGSGRTASLTETSYRKVPMLKNVLAKTWGVRGGGPILVWGFSCQASPQKLIFFFVSFFVRSGARFFAPTHKSQALSRAGAVKVGRRANIATRSHHRQATP
jgi:hypothetical protein